MKKIIGGQAPLPTYPTSSLFVFPICILGTIFRKLFYLSHKQTPQKAQVLTLYE